MVLGVRNQHMNLGGHSSTPTLICSFVGNSQTLILLMGLGPVTVITHCHADVLADLAWALRVPSCCVADSDVPSTHPPPPHHTHTHTHFLSTSSLSGRKTCSGFILSLPGCCPETSLLSKKPCSLLAREHSKPGSGQSVGCGPPGTGTECPQMHTYP